MLSAQCDELRRLASTLDTRYRYADDIVTALLEAADTILSLRDRAQELQAENAKLRELASWMYDRMDESCAVQHPYAPAPISYDLLMQALARASELGIEV